MYKKPKQNPPGPRAGIDNIKVRPSRTRSVHNSISTLGPWYREQDGWVQGFGLGGLQPLEDRREGAQVSQWTRLNRVFCCCYCSIRSLMLVIIVPGITHRAPQSYVAAVSFRASFSFFEVGGARGESLQFKHSVHIVIRQTAVKYRVPGFHNSSPVRLLVCPAWTPSWLRTWPRRFAGRYVARTLTVPGLLAFSKKSVWLFKGI